MNLKYVEIRGRTTYEELKGLFYQYLSDPGFDPSRRMLVDLRDLTDVLAGLWEISKLKKLYQGIYGDRQGAVDVVILTGNKVAYRAARAFALFMRDRRPMNIQVTNSLEDALDRLGIDPDRMQGLMKSSPKDGVVVAFPVHALNGQATSHPVEKLRRR